MAIDGVHYCHNYPTGIMGKPISGDNVARSLLLKNKVSSTVGHCHLFDYSMCTIPTGRKVLGLSAGCYLHHKEEYARNTQRLWWSGLIVKRNVRQGEYDIETIDVIQDGMTDDEYHGYLKGNVLKYVSRYKFKGEPLEDLQKAQWYLNRLIKEVE